MWWRPFVVRLGSVGRGCFGFFFSCARAYRSGLNPSPHALTLILLVVFVCLSVSVGADCAALQPTQPQPLTGAFGYLYTGTTYSTTPCRYSIAPAGLQSLQLNAYSFTRTGNFTLFNGTSSYVQLNLSLLLFCACVCRNDLGVSVSRVY